MAPTARPRSPQSRRPATANVQGATMCVRPTRGAEGSSTRRSASAISSRALPISGSRLARSRSRHRRSNVRMAPACQPAAASNRGGDFKTLREDVGDRPRLRTRRRPGEHLVEHAAEGPDVRCACRPACPRACSGAHVGGGAEDHALRVIAGEVIVGDCVGARAASRRRRSSALARPKSSTFTVPSGAHLDVGGLEVAMDDALLVRGLERFGDLPRHRQRLVERAAARGAMRSASVVALDELDRPSAQRAARRLFDAVDGARCADD